VAQLSQDRCSYKEKLLKGMAREHCGLLANLAFLPTPMSAAVHNLHESVSAAAPVTPGSSAATQELAQCADVGLKALESAWAGAVRDSTGRPSGIASDGAPAAALPRLRSRTQAAHTHAAERIQSASVALKPPQGVYNCTSRPFLFFLPVFFVQFAAPASLSLSLALWFR